MIKKCTALVLLFTMGLTIISSSVVFANEEIVSSDATDLLYIDILMGPDSSEKGQLVSWTLNDDGEFVRVYPDRAVTTATVAVFIGGVFIGYIITTVVDGVVIAATGKSGSEWVSTAIKSVLNRKFTPILKLNCSAIPKYAAISGLCP